MSALMSRKASRATKLFRLGRDLQLLPPRGETSKLVTTALPYVNNTPHLGNIIGCVLSGDVHARYLRLRGHNCLFLGGTDEYGTATEFKAHQEGMRPIEVCDKYFPEHADTYRWLHIDFDIFGRTTNEHHHAITQDIYRQLESNGFIEQREELYTFCAACSKFLADRFVHGVCPKCQYDDARGDQCDKCGALLNPSELLHPQCNYCKGSHVMQKPSLHAFLDLPRLQHEVMATHPADAEAALGRWSPNAFNITNAWIKQGLKQRCITRDLKWGVPVPGMDNKVFYVWFDAPIGYISITQQLIAQRKQQQQQQQQQQQEEEEEEHEGLSWENWWKRDKSDVEVVQFMGKDNTSFHTIIFPSMLLGARSNFATLHRISVTEYLNYEGGKFSKSRGTGVFGPDMVQSGIGADYWRFYMLHKRPETADSSFVWNEFESTVNSVLNDQFGNLLFRVEKLFARHCVHTCYRPTLQTLDAAVAYTTHLEDYMSAMDRFEMRTALRVAFRLIARVNAYLNEEEPWKAIKCHETNAAALESICNALAASLAATVMLHPFIPEHAHRCLERFGVLEQCAPDAIRLDTAWQLLSSVDAQRLDSAATASAPLFEKIDVSELRARFRPPGRAFAVENVDGAITWPFVMLHFADVNIHKGTGAEVRRFLAEQLPDVPQETRTLRQRSYADRRVQDGVDEGEFAVSTENLATQLQANGQLPRINAAVDIYNALSLRTVTVCGLYDVQNIVGSNLRYKRASGHESFRAIGRNEAARAADFKRGDWALVDEADNIITLALTKQSSRVAVTTGTTEAVMCCQGSPAHSKEDVEAFAQLVGAAITRFCGGSCTRIV